VDAHLRRLIWPTRTSFRSVHRRQRNYDPPDPFEGLPSPFEADNPFSRLRQPRIQERLLAALHAPGLSDLSPDEQFVVDQLVERAGDWGFDRFACGGDQDDWRGVPMLVIERIQDMDIEQSRINWGGGRTSTSVVPPAHGSLAVQLRGRTEKSRRVCRDALAAFGAGAHLVVSTEEALLRLRDEGGLRECNVVTPLEAGVLIGVWARATGRGGTFAHWVSADHIYYWALSRAVTPAGWPGFAAFVRGNRVFPDGQRIEALAHSILARLDFLVEALDDLYAAWQRDTNNPTIDEIGSLFDTIVLRGWAIQDNVALLVGLWTGINLSRPTDWSIHSNDWRGAVRRSGQAGRRAIDMMQASRLRLLATLGLRHHAVHREALGIVNLVSEEGTEVTRPHSAGTRKPSCGPPPTASGVPSIPRTSRRTSSRCSSSSASPTRGTTSTLRPSPTSGRM
jgi:hypothetical protein